MTLNNYLSEIDPKYKEFLDSFNGRDRANYQAYIISILDIPASKRPIKLEIVCSKNTHRSKSTATVLNYIVSLLGLKSIEITTSGVLYGEKTDPNHPESVRRDVLGRYVSSEIGEEDKRTIEDILKYGDVVKHIEENPRSNGLYRTALDYCRKEGETFVEEGFKDNGLEFKLGERRKFEYNDQDLILCVSDGVKRKVVERFPEAKDKTYTIPGYIKSKTGIVVPEVPVPMGWNQEKYTKYFVGYFMKTAPYILKGVLKNDQKV